MTAPNPVNKPPNGPRLLLGVLLRPQSAFAALARAPRPALAVAAGLMLGACWATFSAWLAADGHQPTMDRGLPMPAERYYAIAALYLVPLCLLLTGLTGAVAHGAARRLGGGGSMRATIGAVGPAYALPLLVLYLIPDMVAYAVAGRGALALMVRFALPLAVVAVTLRTVQALKAVHGLGNGRALAAALVAAVVQAVPFALLVR